MLQKKKPIVSWYKNFDPTIDYYWVNQLTDINIINTRNITDDFIRVCLENKNRIFLHIYISGMGGTAFEPKIPTVKFMFFQIRKLIDMGFSQKQIIIVIDPVLSNDNGLKALELLLKLLTEFRLLKLRWIRMNLLTYRSVDSLMKTEKTKQKARHLFSGKYIPANDNILKRTSELNRVKQYLFKWEGFYKAYYDLQKKYSTIINLDAGDEPIIGSRHLLAFGYNNIWIDENGNKSNIITYENNNKYKPQVKTISRGSVLPLKRCLNRCILCPYVN